MPDVRDEFAASHPNDVVRRDRELFFAAEVVSDLIDRAQRSGVRVLGLEGFIVGDSYVYPALSRIADFSSDDIQTGASRARDLLASGWRDPPTSEDQMHPDATGRHMIVVVLEEK